MTASTLRKFIGLRVGGGIVTGARLVSPTVVEFDVLDDGEVRQHRITSSQPKETAT